MTWQQFSRWLFKQNLTSLQTKMALILFAVNGEQNAREFVASVKQ